MPEEPAITQSLVVQVLIEGAVLALGFILVAQLLRRYLRQILFLGLLIAALAYVAFAVRGHAGPVWLTVELLGVVIYGAIGWTGVRGSLWWMAAAWAVRPI